MDLIEAKVQSVDYKVPAKPEAGPRKLISDALRAKLADGEAEKLAGELVLVATTAKRNSDKIAAIAEITDRTEGKAIQSIRHAGVFMVAAPSAEAIAALDGWAGDE